MLGGFTEGLELLPHAPIGGYGLGIGTNGGAKFLTGSTMFLLTESEWGRIILESGPILGLAFVLWRTLLTAKLGLVSYQQLKRGEILPIMLFCAGFVSLLNGQFGQPTNLGFAVFICGLCLAAATENNRAQSEPSAPARSTSSGAWPGVRATPRNCMHLQLRRTARMMILLIGNYVLDRQQSMQRFAMMMLDGLAARAFQRNSSSPSLFWGAFAWGPLRCKVAGVSRQVCFLSAATSKANWLGGLPWFTSAIIRTRCTQSRLVACPWS